MPAPTARTLPRTLLPPIGLDRRAVFRVSLWDASAERTSYLGPEHAKGRGGMVKIPRAFGAPQTPSGIPPVSRACA
jgi:hypothetical protein